MPVFCPNLLPHPTATVEDHGTPEMSTNAQLESRINVTRRRTMNDPDLDTPGIDSGQICKLCFQPSSSPNAHVIFQYPLLQLIPKDQRTAFIIRRNSNLHEGINGGALRPPRSQSRTDFFY